ncbi:hypothetical protein WN944_020840 [Citrus x changshan-huyou]|uniref:Uncharacterized protein n=1 Tax=Citrus x changshan-huyou TaxID=2935761 RepID=A0AAP0R2D0_9ROSI
MVGTTLRNKQVHSRSISLPTRLHPNSLKIVQEMNTIKIGRQSSSSSLTAIPSDAAESL